MKYRVVSFMLVALIGVCFIYGRSELPKPVAEAPTVRVAALDVQLPHPDVPKDFLHYLEEPGTKVTLLIAQPGTNFIGIDMSASKLDAIIDDQKNDLTQPPEGGERLPVGKGIHRFANSVEDLSIVAIEIKAPGVPSSKARELIHDADLRNRLIENALRDVRERFTWDQVIRQYQSLLKIAE